MVNRFYQKGTIDGIASTFQDLLKGGMPEWGADNIGYDIGKMKAALKETFGGLADWKAEQIAANEIQEASNYAAFEIIDRAGLSQEMEAYFITDPQSCDICQDWASNNPYDYQEARSMGLPHIGCQDQWSFGIKGGQGDE
jgi:hypothetical protein